MPIRVPVNTIILSRDGKSLVPKVGVPFEFTQKEIDDINRVMPKAIRKVITEDVPAKAEAPVEVTQKSSPSKRQRNEPAAEVKDELKTEGEGDL